MKREVLLIQGGVTTDISNLIENHTWYGSKGAAPRTLELNMVHTDRGGHSKVETEDGQGVLFRENGKELFRGTIFRHVYSNSKKMIIVHDELIYAVKNRDSNLFVGKTADQIARKVFSDAGISIGNIASTGYVIPYLFYDGDTLYDIVMKALQITYDNTGRRYSLYSEGGKVHIARKKDQLKQWVIEDGVNLVEHTYETSIEDTVTKVKLIAEFDKKTITAVAENGALRNRYGTMQHFEKAGEKTTQAQLNAKAQEVLKERGKVRKSFTLANIPGISEVITGVAIYVVVKELNIARPYYVDEDTHSFKGRSHLMTLKLTETDELPEIKAGNTERPKPKEPKKPKKPKKKKETAGEKK